MKHTLLSLLLLVLFFPSHAQSKKRSALFIGNSYTYFNNLPQLVEQLALANGDTLVVDSYAPGGYTFNNHANDANCIAKIYSKDWDFVILQAQSQEPAFSPAQVNAQTLPFALKLDSLIKDNYSCSKTVFFETWGRKFGDASNCAAYPPICTYTGMQNRLKQSYKLFSDLTQGIMAPAGEAFRESIAQNPALELYQPDQSHPSLEGSYLSACVFYETLFQKSVLGNTFQAAVNSNTASILQTIAHMVVRDSLSIWNIGLNLPWADFMATNNGPASFQFQSNSGNLNPLWYFGDGSLSAGSIVNHTYTASGIYTVSHVASDNCYRDSVSKVISVNLPVNLIELPKQAHHFIYPNPAIDKIYFASNESVFVKIFSISGKLIKEELVRSEISISDLKAGMYFIHIQSKAQSTVHRIIVQKQ